MLFLLLFQFFSFFLIFFLTGKVALQRVNRFEASGGGSAEIDSAPSSASGGGSAEINSAPSSVLR
jgi:hypothetical protein